MHVIDIHVSKTEVSTPVCMVSLCYKPHIQWVALQIVGGRSYMCTKSIRSVPQTFFLEQQ